MHKKILPAVALTAGFAWATSGQAATIAISVFDGTTQIGSTVTSTTGTASFTGSDASFSSITVNSQGVPVLTSPDLSSNTLDATASTGFTGTHILTVDVLQTGLTSFSGATSTTGTFNALIGGPGPATENVLINGSTTPLVSQTLPGPASAFGPVNNTVTGLTSDMEQFLITFTAGTQSASASLQFLTTAPVPEPASLTLFGSALVGLGWLGWRRRKSL